MKTITFTPGIQDFKTLFFFLTKLTKIVASEIFSEILKTFFCVDIYSKYTEEKLMT